MLIKDQKEAVEVIRKIKLGDRKAQEKFYKHYRKKIEYFLKRKYPKNDEIEDDISEILIKVFQTINKYDSEKSQFNTWVINIAKNHMIDKLRKNKPLYKIDDLNTFTSYSESIGISNNSDNTSYITIDTNVGTTTNNITTDMTSASSNMTLTSAVDIQSVQSYYCAPDFDLEINSTLNMVTSNMDSCDYSMISMKNSGYNYKEIGAEFNMTESQVSNKINYAKTKMKKNKGE